jgi:hypothetical protein
LTEDGFNILFTELDKSGNGLGESEVDYWGYFPASGIVDRRFIELSKENNSR